MSAASDRLAVADSIDEVEAILLGLHAQAADGRLDVSIARVTEGNE